MGKLVKLTGHARHDVKPGEYAVVFRHVVVTGKASLNKTDLIIVTADEYTRMMAEDTTGRTMLDISTEFGRVVLAGLSNTDLAKVIGKGKWQDLFSPDAARVDFSPTQSADPELVAMIGKTLEGLGPVRNGEDVDMIDGLWSVIALTDDGDKLILEEKAEPKRRSMGVPRTWAKARIEAYAARGQGKEVTTATVDGSTRPTSRSWPRSLPRCMVHTSHVWTHGSFRACTCARALSAPCQCSPMARRPMFSVAMRSRPSSTSSSGSRRPAGMLGRRCT